MHAIVHLGAPKAGSSSIQNTIRLNRKALSDQGIFCYWPSRGPAERALTERFERQRSVLPPQVQHALAKIKNPRAWSRECWDELAAQTAEQGDRVALISSEHFFNTPDPDGLLDALYGIFEDITFILYVRDPVAQFNSHTNQRIRGGARLRDLKSPLRYGYYAFSTFEKMLDRIDRNRIHVRNFDRSNLVNGDVVADLFALVEQVLGKRIDIPVTPPRANESLCAAATVWLMALNETFAPQAPRHLEQRRHLLERFRNAPELQGLPKLRLEHPDLQAILQYNARTTCAWYNETFLAGQVPLPTAGAPAHIPDETEIRAWMRDWLFGYLTPDTLGPVMRAAVPLTDAPQTT